MAGVTALGYIRIGAPDLDEWRTFATDVFGLQVGEAAASAAGDGALYLRNDHRAYRIAVEQGEPGLRQSGFEVANRAALDELASSLETAGVPVKEESSDYALSRSVTALVTCQDPMGNTIELFHGATSDPAPFVSPTGANFITGQGGLGHLFHLVADGEAFRHFYVDLLGFRHSDVIQLGPALATFLHCNPRHHTVAYVETPGNHGCVHTMLEVDDIDAVGRAYDKVLAGAGTLSASLGKHTNDKMVSFYVDTPSGFTVEYGTNGLLIDDNVWTTSRYDHASYWGHLRDGKPLSAED